MFHIRKVHFLLIYTLLIFCSNSLLSQDNGVVTSSLLDDEEKALLDFFAKKDLVPSIDLSQSRTLKKINELTGFQKLNSQLKDAVSLDRIDLSLNHFMIVGDSLPVESISNQNYSNIGISGTTTLFKNPIRIGGNVILNNGVFDPRLSTASINFDKQKFMEQQRQKFNPDILFEDVMDLDKNVLNLSLKEKAEFKTEFLYTVFQQVLANPEYLEFAKGKLFESKMLNENLDSLMYIKDSISIKLDSSINAVSFITDEYSTNSLPGVLNQRNKDEVLKGDFTSSIDSTNTQIQIVLSKIESIKTEVEKINMLNKKYNDLWKLKKNSDFNTVRSIREKVHNLKDRHEKRNQLKELKSFVAKQKDIKKYDKLLLYTKNFDIGFLSINRSDHVANYLALNGIRYSYENENYFGEIAYGNQSLATQFLPSLGSLLVNRYFGRRILYGNAGIKSKNELFRSDFSFLRINEVNNQQDSIVTFPKQNRILGWSGQLELVKDIYLNTKIAVSDFNIGAPVSDSEKIDRDDASISISSIYNPDFSNRLFLETGYFYNGKHYTSLANPFLLSNRHGFNFKTGISFLKNRLIINSDIKLSKGLTSEGNNSFNDIQYLGEMTYRFGKSSSISARFMPNLFSQNLDQTDEVTSNNNIYSISANFQSKVKNNQLYTILNLTNLRSNIQLIDTLSIDKRAYLYLQEVLMLQNGNAFNLTFMTGSEDLSFDSFSDFLLQLDGTIQEKKWSFNIGGQILKQQFLNEWQYGIINRVRCSVFERGSLNLNTIYRSSIKKDKSNTQLQANISVLYSLVNSKKQKIESK